MTTLADIDAMSEQDKVKHYLGMCGAYLVEDNDKTYKFMAPSPEEFDRVVGFVFLFGLNVGKPRESSVIKGWQFGKIYKGGEEVDDKEDSAF